MTLMKFEMNRSLYFNDAYLLAIIKLLKTQMKHVALERVNSYSFLFQRFASFLPFICHHQQSIKISKRRNKLRKTDISALTF